MAIEVAPDRIMRLLKIDEHGLDFMKEWLSAPENRKWLDFGLGRQVMPRPMLKMMAAHGRSYMRLFAPEHPGQPVGVVALSDISAFRTATIWYVLGDKAHARQGLTAEAVSSLLDVGFRGLKLNSVQAWTVATNSASIGLLEKCGFRAAGRFRHAHMLDGLPVDRLLFDLIPSDRYGQ